MKHFTYLLVISLGCSFAWAEPETNSIQENPLQPPMTTSPRETLFGFIEDANQAYRVLIREGRANTTPQERRTHIRRIQGYLDMRELPEYIRTQASIESAVALKEILDRLVLPMPEEVPGAGQTGNLDLWRVPGTNLQIIKITEGMQKGEYLFSSETLSNVMDSYERIEHLPLRTTGPETSPGLMRLYRSEPSSPWVSALISQFPEWVRREAFGHTVWQILGLVLLLVFGFGIMIFLYAVARRRASKFRDENIFRYLLTLIFPITALGVPVLMKRVLRYDLVLGGELLRITDFLLGVLLLLAVLRLIWAVGNRLLVLSLNHPRMQENQMDVQFIRLVGRVLMVITVVVVFLEGGKRLGIPLSSLVAGAGISGLAVALAAQDSLKNILGSVMLILDKPFEVNERIIFKTFQGFVQEIGLRSTKIKLLSGNMASIPNEVLARMEIENVSKRPSLRKILQLHMPLNTPPQQVGRVLERVKELMKDHEGMPEDQPPRIFLQDLTQQHCILQVMFWYAPPKTLDMLAFSEKVMFEMLNIAEEEGVELKMPMYLPPDPVI